MNVANTDYIQATIELFGFFLTVIIAMIFQIITTNEKKSEKKLFVLILLSGFALLVDAMWYIFDGNTSKIAVFINRVSNFAIFICNPFMIVYLTQFICALIEEDGGKTNKVIVLFVYIFAFLAFLVTVSNLFYPWLYNFDDNNIYHRLSGWIVYSAMNGIGLFTCLIMVLVHRKLLSRRRRFAVYFYLLAPIIGIGLQTTKIGISFIQIGIVVGSVVMLISYLIDWIHEEKNDGDATEERKRLWLIESVFGVMILFVSAAIISCVVSLNKVSNKNSEQSSVALSFMVSETVDGALSEPINVSRTMAQSKAIIDALSSDKLEGTDLEQDMLSFMRRIDKEYDYQMIFVASQKTKAYYTYDGLSRYMKVDTDPNDAWYNEFLARNVKYELNIDEDKDNDMTLAVFVNMEVRDNKENLLGVCGVGMSIESLIKVLAQYEDSYDLDISLIDKDGIVQVDTNRNLIGKKLASISAPDNTSDKIIYEKSKFMARLSKYMKGLDWYLIVDDHNPNKLKLIEIIAPSMIIYIIAVLLMVFLSFGFGIMENKRSRILMTSKLLSETDKLTGVKNRNAFEAYKKTLFENATTNPVTQIIMIDINGLKTVNDKYGHLAGDELIIGASRCIRNTLGKIGEVYRLGGDEFVIISSVGKDEVEHQIEQLQTVTEKWGGDLVNNLSISIGVSSSQNDGNLHIDELIKIADERMYADKQEYYRRTGNDRRMS